MKSKNFTKQELEKLYTNGDIFFFNYRKAYQLIYSQNAGFYFLELQDKKLDKKELPYTKAGRYVVRKSPTP